MGLLYAQYPERKPIEKAIKLIISRQLPVSALPFVLRLHSSDHHLVFCSFADLIWYVDWICIRIGRLLARGSDGGYIQQELHDHVPELQVQLCYLGTGQGAQVSPGTGLVGRSRPQVESAFFLGPCTYIPYLRPVDRYLSIWPLLIVIRAVMMSSD